MNTCTFTGYLTEDPILDRIDGVSFLDLKVVVYNYRRTKSTGEKSRTPTYLDCEAWSTGAETIARLATKGTKITLECSAKNLRGEEDFIVFRINQFELPCIDQE